MKRLARHVGLHLQLLAMAAVFAAVQFQLKTNNGIDALARQGGALTGGSYMTGTSSSAPTATTFPMDGATMPSASSGGPPHNTGALVGMTVVRGGVYGTILQHSATAATGLTIDHWHDPTAPGTIAATPAAGVWVIVPGNMPAAWIGLSVATRAVAAADPFLTNDGSTVSEIWNASGGLNRALGSFAHTVGTATYTLTKTFTSTVNDPASSTVHRAGIFQHQVTAAPSTTTTGIMVYETNLSADAIITNNGTDSLAITETVTIS